VVEKDRRKEKPKKVEPILEDEFDDFGSFDFSDFEANESR
jgi:hypothetical protein